MNIQFNQDLTFTKGATHCHTHNSIDDGFQSEKSLCKRAKELNATAVFISDHGTASGWDDFDEAAKEVGLKPIFGVEAYYESEANPELRRSHLILYAMNNNGMHKITKAMARCKLDGEYPCLTDEALEFLRGGDVIATSACIDGVFGSIKMHNIRLNRKISRQHTENEEDVLRKNKEAEQEYNKANEKFAYAKKSVSEAKAAQKQSFVGKQKQVASMLNKLKKAEIAFDNYLEKGTDAAARTVKTALAQFEINVEDPEEFQDALELATQKYDQRKAQLNAEIAEASAIAETLEQRILEEAECKAMRDECKAVFDTTAKEAAKIHAIHEKIKELESEKLTTEQENKILDERLAKMMEIFPDHFYIEVQNHGMEEEKEIYQWVYQIAKKHNLPLIAANDAHISTRSKDDVMGRAIRRACRFKKWSAPSAIDEEMYVKNDAELAEILSQILPYDAVVEAMTNVAKVVDMCNAQIIKESHAPKVKDVKNVKETLIENARRNIWKKYGMAWDEKHEERFNYEIGIIDSMGFNDYFIITADILNIARKIGSLSYERLDDLKSKMNSMNMEELMTYLNESEYEPNLSIGLGRGSGAGSLVCYLLGITNIDPFKYDLLFERFLNPERISMPERYRAFNVNPITQGCAA